MGKMCRSTGLSPSASSAAFKVPVDIDQNAAGVADEAIRPVGDH